MDRERKRKRHESDVPNHSRSRGKHRVLHMHSTKSPARNLLEISGEEYFYTCRTVFYASLYEGG